MLSTEVHGVGRLAYQVPVPVPVYKYRTGPVEVGSRAIQCATPARAVRNTRFRGRDFSMVGMHFFCSIRGIALSITITVGDCWRNERCLRPHFPSFKYE